MNKRVILISFLLIIGYLISLETTNHSLLNTILLSYSERNFSSKPVSDTDIKTILQAGVQAPSARNSQLWHFTVVRDKELIKKVLRSSIEGNVLIVVSGSEVEQRGVNVVFDSALATQNMNITAQFLGYGTRIYGSPIKNINDNLKTDLEIPENYKAISVLRIGNIETDSEIKTSASPRKSLDEVVNYK